MTKKALLLRALWSALAATAYVGLIAGIFSCHCFNGHGEPGLLQPLAGLMLFVFSALVMGILLLLTPLRLYLDGQKSDGIRLLLYTGMWFGVITAAILAVLAVI
jgi:hypothetical protein